MGRIDVCYMAATIHFLSKRWTIFVIQQLLAGPQRFSEIENGLPISGRLLSERLKELEAAGMVTRRIFAEVPVRVEYELTEKGLAFRPLIEEIRNWAEQWGEAAFDTENCKDAAERCEEDSACGRMDDACN
ncbi:winged helix-turn-helix transcriptional regulator [Paenibacillus chartarius]|uniref:Winged helix-turn-helix transcriptional regulator n=1 Tax=Paenibacillus chartarius TaxID=747481 RepID=A0ABV6DGV7_9BACL